MFSNRNVYLCPSYQKAIRPHCLLSQTKSSFQVQACLIFMSDTISGIPFYFHKWQPSPHCLFPFPPCHFPPPLSVLIEKGPPDPFLRWGSHNLEGGSQFLPLCANGGASRRHTKSLWWYKEDTFTPPHTRQRSLIHLAWSQKLWVAIVAREQTGVDRGRAVVGFYNR